MSTLARIITGFGLTQIIGWGTTYYAPTVLSGAMAADTGWSLTAVFAAFSWGAAVSGLVARRIGALVDQHGAQRLMTAGSAGLSLGLVLIATAHHYLQLLLGWTVIGVAMRACLYEAAFTALTVLAGGRARNAISAITLWGGLASTVFWPVGHWLGEACGWRLTFALYALMNLVVCLPLHWRITRPGQAERVQAETAALPPPATATAPSAPVSARPLTDAQRERIVVLLGLVLAAYTVVFATLSAHLVGLLEGLGLAAGAAVTLSSIKGVAQTSARFIEMTAQRWLSPLAVGVIATGLLPLSMFIFGAGKGQVAIMAAGCVVYGAANGLVTIVRGAVPLALFGTAGYGAMLGRISAPGLFVAAIAPTASAWVLERFGTQTLLFSLLLTGAASFAGMVVIVVQARRSAAPAR